MIKRLLCAIMCLLLFLPALTGLAAEPKVIDNANLLAADELRNLEEKAAKIAENHQIDVVILTVWSLDGKTAQDYADDFYDQNGYGIGEDHSGVLFLIAMETRQWWLSTCGDAIYAITDYGIECIFSEMSWYLSDDDYYLAFDAFLDELPVYFEALEAGKPIDGFSDSYNGPGSYSPGEREDTVHYDAAPDAGSFFLALLIGAGIAGVTVLIMRSSMNTKRPQKSAGDYMKQDTYRLHKQQDMFLYSNVSKVRRQENSGNTGGGSSVHRSSGGRKHGGGGGRF